MGARKLLAGALRSVDWLLAPDACAGCRTALEAPAQIGFCDVCTSNLPPEPEAVSCSWCGLIAQARSPGNALCPPCAERGRSFGLARAAGAYEGDLARWVTKTKYGRDKALGDALGRWLAGRAGRLVRAALYDWITEVPLHPTRLRERGFNQATLLARALSRDHGVPHRPLLNRWRQTREQAGLTERGRRENTSNAFSARSTGSIPGRRILLVDDVLTTGATADACASSLLAEGARRVDVLVLARADSQPGAHERSRARTTPSARPEAAGILPGVSEQRHAAGAP